MKTIVYISLALLALGVVGQCRWLAWFAEGDLREMVTAKQAAELSQFYRALSIVVGSSSTIKTTGEFRQAQQLAAKIMQENTPGGGSLAAINAPIDRRLKAALDRISEDFRCVG